MAEAAAPGDGEDEGVAGDLWEIERMLRNAQRRIEALVR